MAVSQRELYFLIMVESRTEFQHFRKARNYEIKWVYAKINGK
jgi:hypothetical protein